ncbi:hypothetical protein QN277_007717 [Acacia crassicarpa]|uniref:Xyloglucan endotransglucosylase/hydrolase n=1 Tax=Acacia crassicarpa TaxID=499986 RepID=A0AAE1IV36_9FABA|nr:hypothetical protein QN277_007717 [Acacia crassicarpa]
MTNHNNNPISMIGFLFISVLVLAASSAENFNQDFQITWGDGRGMVLDDGSLLTLSLDKSSGSGFSSVNEYLFAKIDMQLKLVPGNSAGTVTTYYLSSEGSTHDEIDFEFLGNLSGDPYTLHTNIYALGTGNREQQFHLWFDPTLDFHTYSILWNPLTIIFSVDGRPIREYKNMESRGIPFPKSQAMRIYGSLWDAEDWATRGGLVKTDWTQAPFTTSFRGFTAQAGGTGDQSWLKQSVDAAGQASIKEVQAQYMIYNYCTDTTRFPQGVPPECSP